MRRALLALWLLLAALGAEGALSPFKVAATSQVSVTVNWNGTLSDGTNTCTNTLQFSSSAGPNAPTTCTWTVSNGAKTITATGVSANSSGSSYGTGSALGSWGGTACNGQSAGGSCSATVSGNTDLSATFYPKDNDVRWVATGGSNASNGTTPALAYATLTFCMSQISAGDTCYYNDGTFTGDTNMVGGGASFSTNLTSGNSSKKTRVLAYNPRAVTVSGQYARLPMIIFKRLYLEVAYIDFRYSSADVCGVDGGDVAVGDSAHIWIHDVSCAYAKPQQGAPSNTTNVLGLTAGTCDDCVIEDNLVFGFGARYSVSLYRSINSVVRRNVMRYDGIKDGEPRACLAMYDVDKSIAENNLCLDYYGNSDAGGQPMSAFFATCSTTQSIYPYGLGTLGFYGNIALNVNESTASEVNHYDYDSLCSTYEGTSGTVAASATYRDNVADGGDQHVNNGSLVYIGAESLASTRGHAHNFTWDNNTVHNVNMGSSGRSMYLGSSSMLTFTITDSIFDGGSFSSQGCFQQAWSGTPTASANARNACDNALYTALPGSSAIDPDYANTSNYVEWIQTGAALNKGATVTKRYSNGTLTGTDLWPWTNEAAWRTMLCQTPDSGNAATCEANNATSCTIYTRTNNTKGLCSGSKTITQYVWETLSGHSSPW